MAALLVTPLMVAQPRDSNEQQLGVARVGLADGDVTVQRGGQGDRMQAMGGRPLVAEDVLATGPGSRAELQFDLANYARLGPASAIRILSLGNRSYRFEVLRGTATYSQLRGGEADVAMDAKQISVRPLKLGVYRLVVHDSGQIDVTARKGKAELFSPDGIQILNKGKRMIVRGQGPDTQFQVAKAEPKDGLDKWNERRDKLLRREPRYSWLPNLGFGFGYGWGYPYWGLGLGYSYWPSYYYTPRVFVSYRGGGRGHIGGGGGGRGGGGPRGGR